MGKPNREYKSSMFKDLFNNVTAALELYNALTNSRFTVGDGLRFTTLENALFMDWLNDISFMIGNKLVVLIEHQASINENMPLRALIYIARIYEKIIDKRAIYRSTLLTIPTPEFYVLYNGAKDYPDEVTLRLSDAFGRVDIPDVGLPALDLTVRVLNVNKGHNKEILEKCETLRDYATFIGQVRERQQSGLELEAAITAAIDICVAKGILVEYLENNGSEVRNMLFTEFNIEEAREVWFEEGMEKGKAEGKEEGKEEVARSLFANGVPLDIITKSTGLPAERVRALVN